MALTVKQEAEVVVKSPKGLKDETDRALVTRFAAAGKALAKSAKIAVDAWSWAFEHGLTGYRETLRKAGQEHSGWYQQAYTVARAMHATSTPYEDLAEAAGSEKMLDLAEAARGILAANGLVKAGGKKSRTPLEMAAKFLDYFKGLHEQMGRPAAERAEKNPSCPKLQDVPTFNAHECMAAILAGQPYNIILATDLPREVMREAVAGGS